jgi:hypothetical protein
MTDHASRKADRLGPARTTRTSLNNGSETLEMCPKAKARDIGKLDESIRFLDSYWKWKGGFDESAIYHLLASLELGYIYRKTESKNR